MHPDQVPSPELIREAWIGTNWIVELSATGSCDRRDFRGMPAYVKTPEALVKLVQDRNPGQWGWERFSPCEPQHSICCGCSVFGGSEPAWAVMEDITVVGAIVRRPHGLNPNQDFVVSPDARSESSGCGLVEVPLTGFFLSKTTLQYSE